jgi:hypothetical protein
MHFYEERTAQPTHSCQYATYVYTGSTARVVHCCWFAHATPADNNHFKQVYVIRTVQKHW